MADNAVGMTFASGLGGGAAFTSKTSDSLFVGESDNVGNPTTKAEIAAGRSCPSPSRTFRSAATNSTIGKKGRSMSRTSQAGGGRSHDVLKSATWDSQNF